MREEDPTELADQKEREADKLEQHADEVQGKIDDVRQDWERKRADPSVPGAPPPEGDAGEDDAGQRVTGEDGDPHEEAADDDAAHREAD